MTPSALARQQALAQWVYNALVSETSSTVGSVQLLPVGGDAGFRSYYRIETPAGPLLAVDAPPETEDSRAFAHVAKLLTASGIKVPDIKLVNFDHGFMLIEDFGNTLMLDLLNDRLVDTIYKDALILLGKIQTTKPQGIPAYDHNLLQAELNIFSDWFLTQLMGVELSDVDQKMFAGLHQMLISSALEQPESFVHRDYHSRNLMMMPGPEIGIIDFQGALRGPVLYDVVSLLKDCYVRWPREKVESWLRFFVNNHDELKDVDWSTCLRWFDWIGLQRHLKCLGIFTRLWLRDGKPQYLKDMPTTLMYAVDVCNRYPAFKAHGVWLQEHIVPVLEQRINEMKEPSANKEPSVDKKPSVNIKPSGQKKSSTKQIKT